MSVESYEEYQAVLDLADATFNAVLKDWPELELTASHYNEIRDLVRDLVIFRHVSKDIVVRLIDDVLSIGHDLGRALCLKAEEELDD